MIMNYTKFKELTQKWFKIWEQEGIFDTYFGYNSIQCKMPSETKYTGNGVKFEIRSIKVEDQNQAY